MDKGFQDKLRDAARTREHCVGNFKVGPHAKKMKEMIVYGGERGLLTGNIFDGTASEEYLGQMAEGAAFILENHGERIGRIDDFSKEQKLNIISSAKKIAEEEQKLNIISSAKKIVKDDWSI